MESCHPVQGWNVVGECEAPIKYDLCFMTTICKWNKYANDSKFIAHRSWRMHHQFGNFKTLETYKKALQTDEQRRRTTVYCWKHQNCYMVFAQTWRRRGGIFLQNKYRRCHQLHTTNVLYWYLLFWLEKLLLKFEMKRGAKSWVVGGTIGFFACQMLFVSR